MIRSAVLYSTLFFSLGALVATAQAQVVSLHGDGPWDVTSTLDVAPESNPDAIPNDEAFKPVKGSVVSMGLVSGTYWFRTRLRNDSSLERFVLAINNPRLGLVELWSDSGQGVPSVSRVGDVEPQTSRALGRRPAAFEMTVSPGTEKTVYLRINHHGSLQFTVDAWPYTQFLRHQGVENLLVGALCGAVGIFLFYNVLLLIQVRRWTYFYFTLFVLCYLFYLFAMEGIGNDYIWRGNEWWAVRGIVLIYGMTSLALHAFTRVFLGTKRRVPKWDQCIVGGMLVSAVVAAGSLTWSLTISYLAHFLVIATPLYVLPAALVCWRGGYRPAGFFFLAWSVLMVCAAVLSMVSLGWIPKSSHAETVVHLGFAAALALFSLALDSRARMSAARFRTRLEHQVEERTIELRDALDNVKTLRGMIPICSHCKKIRDDEGYWNRVEAYLQRHGDVSLTHGVCPDCANKHYRSYSDECGDVGRTITIAPSATHKQADDVGA